MVVNYHGKSFITRGPGGNDFFFFFSYDKIRVVGKGAFGQAVLYCRKSDGLMSIIKEVNMLDLVKTPWASKINKWKSAPILHIDNRVGGNQHI